MTIPNEVNWYQVLGLAAAMSVAGALAARLASRAYAWLTADKLAGDLKSGATIADEVRATRGQPRLPVSAYILDAISSTSGWEVYGDVLYHREMSLAIRVATDPVTYLHGWSPPNHQPTLLLQYGPPAMDLTWVLSDEDLAELDPIALALYATIVEEAIVAHCKKQAEAPPATLGPTYNHSAYRLDGGDNIHVLWDADTQNPTWTNNTEKKTNG